MYIDCILRPQDIRMSGGRHDKRDGLLPRRRYGDPIPFKQPLVWTGGTCVLYLTYDRWVRV